MKKLLMAMTALFFACNITMAQNKNDMKNSSETYFTNHPFLWGAASASYQVEGAYQADGKGKSVWDVWMNQNEIGGKDVNGNVAINFYDREQYLKDIQLLKKLGLNSYRFSVAWPRIIPNGMGEVNKAAIEHYRTFIKDLKEAGIEPVMTLYHWDMPYALYKEGGWDNRQSVKWYTNYAQVIFDNFKDLVKIYVLSNEMLIETEISQQAEDIVNKKPSAFSVVPAPQNLARALNQFNHKLLAVASAAKLFHTYHIKQGEVGAAFPLFPSLSADHASQAKARLVDGIVNRWFLDPIYKGTYPEDILNYAKSQKLKLTIQPGDAAEIHSAQLSYLGINYYAPLIVQAVASSSFYGLSFPTLPNQDYAFNGPNRPDQFEALLMRVKEDYGNPAIIITENGAGFDKDDELKNGQIADIRRTNYLKTHIAAMQRARSKGVRVYGYHVWSSHDNLEWISGYGRRFGMIYVDFKSQQRILKNSAMDYGAYVKSQLSSRK